LASFQVKLEVGLVFGANCDTMSSTFSPSVSHGEIIPTFLSVRHLETFLYGLNDDFYSVDLLGRKSELSFESLKSERARSGLIFITDSKYRVVAKLILH